MASNGATQGLRGARGSWTRGRELAPELAPPREDMSQASPRLASRGEEVLWATEGVFGDNGFSESQLLLESRLD